MPLTTKTISTRGKTTDAEQQAEINKIGKAELALLVKMLGDLNYSEKSVADAKTAYGYHANPDQWNEDALRSYRATTLKTRMNKPDANYTFFIAYNEQQEPVSLISSMWLTSRVKTREELWLLNIAPVNDTPAHRQPLLEHIAAFAKENTIKEIGGSVTKESGEAIGRESEVYHQLARILQKKGSHVSVLNHTEEKRAKEAGGDRYLMNIPVEHVRKQALWTSHTYRSTPAFGRGR